MVEKTRNGGEWTEARFTSFVKSVLRGARWPPRYQSIRAAKVGYGLYQCAICGTIGPPTLPPEEGKKARRNNATADHTDPVVDPRVGFVDWNTFIERLYVEVDGFQCLCHKCNKEKMLEEIAIRKETRNSQSKEED